MSFGGRHVARKAIGSSSSLIDSFFFRTRIVADGVAPSGARRRRGEEATAASIGSKGGNHSRDGEGIGEVSVGQMDRGFEKLTSDRWTGDWRSKCPKDGEEIGVGANIQKMEIW